MKRGRDTVERVQRLLALDNEFRAAHPDLAMRGAVLDLLTGCGFQRFHAHPVTRDVDRLDDAVALLDRPDQRRVGGDFEGRALRCVGALHRATARERGEPTSLDSEDALHRLLITVPTRVVLGRDDDEAATDLVCWNEALCLLDGVSVPYRCASRIGSLAYWNPADRYGVIDRMVAVRDRYESAPAERLDLDLDREIRVAAVEFVGWFARTGVRPSRMP